jgi:glutamate synthase domain-containing protein 2
MKVVIIGGNDCMVCHYQAICKKYECKAKIFTQPKSNLDRLIGNPELIVLFTHPTAHEMVAVAKKKALRKNILLVQSHCGSGNALRNILESASQRGA